MTQVRKNNRAFNQIRPISIKTNVNSFAEGSCLITAGNTQILCTASVEGKIPAFLKGTGSGWVTAEYGMLPRSTETRMDRESVKGKQTGRTQEIQRLIGRSLRSCVDLKALGENQIKIDCDVLSADAGTRTLAITGGFIALYLALEKMVKQGSLQSVPIKYFLAAVSCGIINDVALLDLDYSEDSSAQVDSNFVITDNGNIVEIQSSAEKDSFTEEQFNQMFSLAKLGIKDLIALQKQAIEQK
jgi:ribonuclease PH